MRRRVSKLSSSPFQSINFHHHHRRHVILCESNKTRFDCQHHLSLFIYYTILKRLTSFLTKYWYEEKRITQAITIYSFEFLSNLHTSTAFYIYMYILYSYAFTMYIYFICEPYNHWCKALFSNVKRKCFFVSFDSYLEINNYHFFCLEKIQPILNIHTHTNMLHVVYLQILYSYLLLAFTDY